MRASYCLKFATAGRLVALESRPIMRFKQSILRCLLLVVALTSMGNSVVGKIQAGPPQSRQHKYFLKQRTSILEDLRFELRQVSDWCHQLGLQQGAVDVTQLSLDLTTDGPKTRPPQLVALPISQKLPEEERQWRERVQKLREESAKELYSLARKAIPAKLPSLAFRLIEDVLRLDPDQKNARGILGQEQFHDPLRDDDQTYAGEWVSPYEAKKRGGRIPHILHERFGWIPREHEARYDQGMRLWKGKWIAAQKETLIRSDFRNAWEIESEHFLVKTNVGLEAGVVLSGQLEIYYEWLHQKFAAFFDTPRELESRFRIASIRGRMRTESPMKVLYFATREEYLRKIRGKVPPEIETNGLYWQSDSTCYFFKNDHGLDTLFHEATHQIFDIPTRRARKTAATQLARLRRRRPQEWILGGDSEFWLIEGLACYFESFSVEDGAIVVGRPDHIRIVAARTRLLRDNFYMPLETFCRLGKDEFQHHANVKQLYSQASGVAHFLMHYDDGRYRDDLIRLLTSMYQPDARNLQRLPNLSTITEVPFATLDQQYRDHMAQ
jgi:hypothetical protein